MRTVAVVAGERVVCERCAVADRTLARLRGLLGRRELPPGDALLLTRTGSIHMFFMRFPIDAVFLDEDMRVVRIAHALAPWRVAVARGAKRVLELAAGECERRGIRVGDRFELRG